MWYLIKEVEIYTIREEERSDHEGRHSISK
jgi:hypothetical protein